MKKLYLTMLIAMIFLNTGKASGIQYEPLTFDGPRITITLEFGKKPYCTLAIAFCRIDIGVGSMVGTAESSPNGNGGRSWILAIPRQNLANSYPGLLPLFDGQNTVTFEDTFVLSQELQNALGAMKNVIIQGNSTYPIRYVNGEFLITFPL